MDNQINRFIIKKVKNVIYVDFQRFREENQKKEESIKEMRENFIKIDHENNI